MASKDLDLAEIENQLNAFRRGKDAIVMATVNGEGLPEASYAPCVEFDKDYFVLVSELASHTGNMTRSSAVSIIFTEETTESVHAFARKRLIYHCRAKKVSVEDALHGQILAKMVERFGNLINTLAGLKDFHIFKLEPQSGQFVAGFGLSFIIDFSNGTSIRHQNPV